VWSIPGEKMKMKRPIASRSRRAPSQFCGNSKRSLEKGNSFSRRFAQRPGACRRTINAALRRLGFAKDEMTGHGFRSAASSMLNESGLWNADAIERQLAHVDNDSVRRAYARADFWDERVRMMAWWADRCDEMRRGAATPPEALGAARL
jgi:integrase